MTPAATAPAPSPTAARATAPAAATTAPPAPPAEQTPRERLRLVLVLGSLIALGPLTIDLYLPALPTLTEDLGATAAAVQLTLTGTLLGLAAGQLVLGPLSDALGRKRPLVAGTALHVLASVLCAFAPDIATLGALRALQGFGGAAAAVIALAVVRDLYDGLAAATVLSRLMLVLGVAPVLAPTLGGELLRHTDWRGIFVVLAVVGTALAALAAFALPESLPPERRRSGGVLGTARAYAGLFHDRTFVGLVLVAGLAMAALFAYVAGSSFVFQEGFGLSQQQFGLVFGAGAVALIGATQANPRLLRRWSPQAIVTAAAVAGTGAAVVLLLLALTGVGGLAGVLVPLWAVLASVGLIMPNAPALALSRHGSAAGTAAAVLGAVQFGVGALAAPVVGLLGSDRVAMSAVVLGGAAGALVVLLAVVRPWGLPTGDAAPEVARPA